ncbi:KAP family P-loop NTPase fold protein, partial [Nitrosomonas sp. ANs5]|uniref:KAP family P-loop NTPase fold protein n=1 Tax=Nitrosomonas sp. ANs5 TaxID=3423941 RepID=UPI003D337B3B
DIDVSPIVIDGSWGTGKTEFCHKLINLMQKSETHHLIYIDAFKADHANEPLMTVLAEVIKVLPEGESKQNLMRKALPAVRYGLKTLAKAGVSHILRQDAANVVDEFDKEIQKTADKAIDATVESLLKDHVKAEQNLKAFQTALAEISAKKPIILFVDELDRCRPNFAVDMLEIVKHTFDVDAVSFILVTNTQQLKASVNHCYGHAVDAQRYLDKFVKFTINLPETVNTGRHKETIAAIEYYKNLVCNSALLKEYRLYECGSIRIIEKLITVNKLSLREDESVVRHIEIYVTLSRHNYLTRNATFGIKLLTIFAITLYCIKPEIATSILNNKLDAKLLGKIFGINSLSSEQQRNAADEEIIYYLLGSSAQINSDIFTPSNKNAEVWKNQSSQYFTGLHTLQYDNYSLICVEAIQVLAMC